MPPHRIIHVIPALASLTDPHIDIYRHGIRLRCSKALGNTDPLRRRKVYEYCPTCLFHPRSK